MAPVFASATSSTLSGATGTSASVNMPASVASGDLLLLTCMNSLPTTFGTLTPTPSGTTMTALDSSTTSTDCHGADWYRVAGGSEATSWAIAQGSTTGFIANLCRYTGAHPTSPIAAHMITEVSGTTASNTTPTFGVTPQVTGVVATDTVVAVYFFGNDTTTAGTMTAPTGTSWVSRATYGPTTQTGTGNFPAWMTVIDITGQTGTVAAPVNCKSTNTVGSWVCAVLRIAALPVLPPRGLVVAPAAVMRAATR